MLKIKIAVINSRSARRCNSRASHSFIPAKLIWLCPDSVLKVKVAVLWFSKELICKCSVLPGLSGSPSHNVIIDVYYIVITLILVGQQLSKTQQQWQQTRLNMQSHVDQVRPTSFIFLPSRHDHLVKFGIAVPPTTGFCKHFFDYAGKLLISQHVGVNKLAKVQPPMHGYRPD